jgi:hypothetical protein
MLSHVSPLSFFYCINTRLFPYVTLGPPAQQACRSLIGQYSQVQNKIKTGRGRSHRLSFFLLFIAAKRQELNGSYE